MQNEKTEISPKLVAKAKAGNQATFSELYRLTSTELYRAIRAMVHDEDTAWDIQQDTYLRADQGLGKLAQNEAFLPWLRRIAVNVTATRMRKRLPMTFTDLTDEDDEPLEQVDLRIEAQLELPLDRKETSLKENRRSIRPWRSGWSCLKKNHPLRGFGDENETAADHLILTPPVPPVERKLCGRIFETI